MKERFVECNFDGLAGPTHNYSGLAFGNTASMKNRNIASNPREAAEQCLHKMAFMMRLGILQGVLPPHERPYLPLLREIGFSGSDREVACRAAKEAPALFYACCSASPMWAANAATFTPSVDAADKKAHITPANLLSEFHRSIEAAEAREILKKIFSDEALFTCHSPLPSTPLLSDEGAANHTRLCREHGEAGLHLFTYGKSAFEPPKKGPLRYPARQSLEASQAVARRHLIDGERLIFARQNSAAIDAGVFHSDVAAVGYKNLLLLHERAFEGSKSLLLEIAGKMERLCGSHLIAIAIGEEELPLEVAVKSYLFNSQIVEAEGGETLLIAPEECNSYPAAKRLLEAIAGDPKNPISKVHAMDLKESMQNGGGPACLRLRVALSRREIASLHQKVLLTEKLYEELLLWVKRNYRDRLNPKDLADPALLDESQKALDELTTILELGPLYSFQR